MHRRLYTRYFYYVLNRVFHREIKLISMNFGPIMKMVEIAGDFLVGLKTLKIPA